MQLIAIDIGGTIEETWSHKTYWFKKNGYVLGDMPIGRVEVIKKTNCSVNFYLDMVKDVYSDENIMEHKLVHGVKDGLKEISKVGKIILLSSRAQSKIDLTIKWLIKNEIRAYINDIIFLGDVGDKIEWCKDNKINYFIDDDIRHLYPEDISLKFNRIWYYPSQGRECYMKEYFHICSSWKEISNFINLKLRYNDFQINK